MKKFITAVLCSSFVFAASVDVASALDAKELVGTEQYTRSNLKARGKTIYFHNMRDKGKLIPAGTPVLITKVREKYIKFEIPSTGKQYKLEALSSQYDKYFVSDVKILGLSSLDAKAKENLKSMRIYPGMKKEDVYLIRGCPSWIGPGAKSWNFTFTQIMDSNNWYYNKNKGKEEYIVHFAAGRVSKIEKLD